jgi:hypothetical protein
VTESGKEHLRPWREVAAELAQEHDPQRIHDLVTELSSALDAQTTIKLTDIPKRK